MIEEVILVNSSDEPVGKMEKLEAHEKGLLHRAFSVFIFNSMGQMLLQRRALTKYHSGGLWTNACCSHPRPGEHTLHAATRRLEEEMGLHCELVHCFSFIYKVSFENGLTENELDHIYIGWTDNPPSINPEEVHEFKYLTIEKVVEDVKGAPQLYTEWFKISIEKVLDHLNGLKK